VILSGDPAPYTGPRCQARQVNPLTPETWTVCGSSKELESWVDLTGALRAYCGLQGHFEDVWAQAHQAENEMRAAHEREER
jgi:hypothetical protein